MTVIQKSDVEHVALLARLALSEEEKEVFTGQLEQILEHAGRIQALDTKNIPPTSHVVPLINVARPDATRPCLTSDEALSNAPKEEDGGFAVPKIV